MSEKTHTPMRDSAAALGAAPRRRGAWRCAAVAAFAFCCAAASATDSAVTLEYKVKAGYLFNFAKFVEWPAKTFPAADSPFIIAVLDAGEAAPVLQELLGGKLVNGRPVVVKAVETDSLCQGAHILFVPRGAVAPADSARTALAASATLVVGEADQFAERHGMVGFQREEESIRLTLNLERTTEAGLKVSAKLASVARLVKSKPVR